MTYERNICARISCPQYIKIPNFLIHYITPFFIWGLILELTSHLTFIPIIFQFRISLWVNEISQLIFWPIFFLSVFLTDLSIRDYKTIPPGNRSKYVILIFLIPIFILVFEPLIFLSETDLLIPDDLPQTRVSEQKYQSIKSEIVLLSLVIIPLATPVSKCLQDKKLRSLNIEINRHHKINLQIFFPVMWMSFIISLCGVFVYNFRTFH